MKGIRYRWPSPPEGTRILVVEDDTNHQLLLRSYLSRLDHGNIAVARDATAALDELDRRPAAIAFLDIHIAGDVTGLDLLQNIAQRETRPFVVMMSADSTLSNVETSISDGARFFIAKPFAGKKVHEALERYYRQPCPLL